MAGQYLSVQRSEDSNTLIDVMTRAGLQLSIALRHVDSSLELRPSSRKTTAAAERAASEAPSTAIPQLAFLRLGASSDKIA